MFQKLLLIKIKDEFKVVASITMRNMLHAWDNYLNMMEPWDEGRSLGMRL